MIKSEMINKKATLETLFHLVKWSRLADKENEAYMNGFRDAFEDCYTAVELMQTVETERKTGKWLPVAKCLLGHPVIMNYCCSECKEKAYQDENGNDFLTTFCPNCGAEMEE